MTDRVLEQRLYAAAHALDEVAPAFDARRTARPRRRLRWVLAVAVATVLVGAAVQPSALSAVARFLGVTQVDELAPLGGVAPPFLGEAFPREGAQRFVDFRVRTIAVLGEPRRFYARNDLVGGMVSVSYAGGIVLSQWSARDVAATVEVVPANGIAEDVGSAVWIAGKARGTFVVTGADGALHREEFVVGSGALVWEHAGVGFLLQGAGTKADAVRLASSVN
jgi:hypothetical protein